MRLVCVFLAATFFSSLLLTPTYAEQLGAVSNAGGVAVKGALDASVLGRAWIARGVRDIAAGRQLNSRPLVGKGYFEVYQGLLCLLAASVASKMASKDQSNANRLGEIPGESLARGSGAPFSPSNGDSSSANSTSATMDNRASGLADSRNPMFGGQEKNSQITSLDFDQLENGDITLRDATDLLKDEYGISRKQLLDALAKGGDGSELVTGASKNSLTVQEASSAHKSALEGLELEKDGSPPVNVGGSTSEPTHANKGEGNQALSQGSRDELRRKMNRGDFEKEDEGAPSMEMSDDVRQALEAKVRETRSNEVKIGPLEELSLFDVVHNRYRKRERFFRFGEPPSE